MLSTLKNSVPKLLRYVFLVLTVGGGLLVLLELSAYLGIGSGHPFLRGEIDTRHLAGPVQTMPLPGDGGQYRVYDFGERKLVLLDFPGMTGLLRLKHVAFLFFQNLGWVLIVFGLYQMFRIFKNLEHRATFAAENTRRIRWIAAAVPAYPVAGLVSDLLFKGIVSGLPGQEVLSTPGVVFSEQILLGGLLGLVIFALAEAFRYGTHLQQEQDLTI